MSPVDLAAVMRLEGWTNDRLVKLRQNRLPQNQWVFGRPNASVIMAAFLHAAPNGQRFSSGALGAWYASDSEQAAIAEVGHHLRREAVNTGIPRMIQTYRTYRARLVGQYVDIRRQNDKRYRRDDYAAGQAFGESCRRSGEDGILYDSLRLRGGTNVVAYHPPNIQGGIQVAHYELTVPVSGRLTVRRLS